MQWPGQNRVIRILDIECILNSYNELRAELRPESFVYSLSLLLSVSPVWFSLSLTSNGRRRQGLVQVSLWPLLVKVQEISPSLHPTPNYPSCLWMGVDTRWATQALMFVLNLALFAVKLGWRRIETVRFAPSYLGGHRFKRSFLSFLPFHLTNPPNIRPYTVQSELQYYFIITAGLSASSTMYWIY
jgi:hypothetical protein